MIKIVIVVFIERREEKISLNCGNSNQILTESQEDFKWIDKKENVDSGIQKILLYS